MVIHISFSDPLLLWVWSGNSDLFLSVLDAAILVLLLVLTTRKILLVCLGCLSSLVRNTNHLRLKSAAHFPFILTWNLSCARFWGWSDFDLQLLGDHLVRDITALELYYMKLAQSPKCRWLRATLFDKQFWCDLSVLPRSCFYWSSKNLFQNSVFFLRQNEYAWLQQRNYVCLGKAIIRALN